MISMGLVGSLLGKVPVKVWVFLLAAVVLTTIITLSYNHYTGLLDENSTLRTNVAKHEVSKEIQDKTISDLKQVADSWKESTEVFVDRLAELQRADEDAELESRRLDVLFAEHDFSRLARKKPGLIERRINNASDKRLRMFECKTSPGGCVPSGGGEANRSASSPSP